MKRLCIILIMIIAIFMCASCKERIPTETPLPTEEELQMTADELKEYTIIYPSLYNKYRMEDVYSLRTAMETFCGADINVISDKEECEGKKMILASSQMTYFCRDEVNSFYGTLDYIIAFDEESEDIVIGGANYYGDVLAIRTFCEQYLTDDGIKKLSDKKTVNVDPNMTSITACMLGAYPFLEYGSFCDMVKAGFNTVLVDASLYTEEQMHEFVRWCAIENIDIVMRSVLYTDIYFDSPSVKGHLIIDEPYGEDAYRYYTTECEKYVEAYGRYSWQPYINIIAQTDVIKELKKSDELFESVKKISFKVDAHTVREMVLLYSNLFDYANYTDKSFIAGINVAMSFDGYTQYEMMRLMSYVGLCFGADGIEYFNYAGSDTPENGVMVDSNFNKESAWHYAVEINYETENAGNILRNYTYSGAFMFYDSYSTSVWGEPVYKDTFKNIVEVIYDNEKTGRYAVGAFKNEQTGETAYMILNLSSKSTGEKMKLRVSTYNTKIWVDGNEMNANSSDGLKIILEGTECVIVEVSGND